MLDPESRSDSARMTLGAGTPVAASGETPAVGTGRRDAADDPEIWADPADPTRGLILGTDKQAGLYVYDLAGQQLQFLAEGRLNNVDLRSGFPAEGRAQILIGASNRSAGGVSFFLADPVAPGAPLVRRWGFSATTVSEPYGFCLGRRGEGFVAVMVGVDGDVSQYGVTEGAVGPVLVQERSFAVGSQSEGCVVDDAKGILYVAEEAKGIWRYSLDPATGSTRTLLAGAPSAMLAPDVEGLGLLREGDKTWLIASSQGDSAFAVWRVDGAEPAYAGRFSVVAGAGADAVTGTDGLAALGGAVGVFPEGLVVVQDDADTPGETASTLRSRQNFKLVDWRTVKLALGL